MPTAHHRYGGSTINRTLHCPAWRTLSDDMPTQPSSTAADTGSLLHECMEDYYNNGTSFEDMLKKGRSYNGIKLNPTMLTEKLAPALNATEQVLDAYGIEELSVEPFVELIEGLAGGSIDMLGVSGDGKTVLILDYKFGYYQVSPESPQLLFYALAAAVDPKTASAFEKVERIISCIIQPDNADYTSTQPKTHEYTLKELDAFEDTVYTAIELSEDKSQQDPVCGEWCKFCPAEALCPAKTGLVRESQLIDATAIAQLETALPMADKLESWIASVRKLAHEQLERGVSITGYKIVDKRASRVWSSEADAEAMAAKIKKLTKVTAYNTKLKSPAQMEKITKELGIDFERFAPFISSVSSGTTLALESDKRQPALPSLALKRLADRL